MQGLNKGSKIFMLELMISILFFIVIVAICLQCLAGSYAMSKQARELSNAVNIVSNAAEEFYGSPNFGNFTTYYSNEWDEVKRADEATYTVTGIANAEVGNNSLISTMSITVTRVSDDREVYSLNLKKGIGLED